MYLRTLLNASQEAEVTIPVRGYGMYPLSSLYWIVSCLSYNPREGNVSTADEYDQGGSSGRVAIPVRGMYP